MVHRSVTAVPLIGLTFFIAIAFFLLIGDSSSHKNPAVTVRPSILAAEFTPGSVKFQFSSKNIVDCSFFDGGVSSQEFKTDNSLLPSYLTTFPQESRLCGSNISLQATYLTTTLEDAVLFTYYKNIFSEKKCSTNYLNGNGSFPSLTFACSDGNGSIRPYKTIAGYTISFHPQK